MNSNPLISIIVPVYNIIPYLSRCIHSIMNQTYTNLEIILVDDGSNDGTEKLCDELATKDNRIKVFHKQNGGSSDARNFGLARANGKYIGFVDSDDYIEPQMYESLIEAIQKYDTKCAQVGRDEIAEDGSMLANICEPPAEEEIISPRFFLEELLMHRGDCSFCTKLFAREIFIDISKKEHNGDDEIQNGETRISYFPIGALNEDFHILVKSLGTIGDIVSLPMQNYHVFYRMGSNSRTTSKDVFSRVFADNVDNADMVGKLVASEYPEDKELADIALRFGAFQRLDYLLHIPVHLMKKEGSSESGNYASIVKWIRGNYCKIIGNKYLTKKNKIYLTLFAIAPKGIRVIHKKIKRL